MNYRETIFEIIRSKVKTKFNEDTKIETLELDSLDLFEIVLSIEEELGISIDDELLPSIKSIKDLIKIVETKLDSKT